MDYYKVTKKKIGFDVVINPAAIPAYVKDGEKCYCFEKIFNGLSEIAANICQIRNNEILLESLQSVREQIQQAIENDDYKTEHRENILSRFTDIITEMETPKQSLIDTASQKLSTVFPTKADGTPPAHQLFQSVKSVARHVLRR